MTSDEFVTVCSEDHNHDWQFVSWLATPAGIDHTGVVKTRWACHCGAYKTVEAHDIEDSDSHD